MTGISARGRVTLVCIPLFVAVLSSLPLAAASREDQAALRTANERWRGARCRSLQQITAKKKKSGAWTKCELIFYGSGGNQRVQVLLSDGTAVRRAFYGGTIPVGTEFVASGWAVDDKGSLHLELELVGHPVRIRVYYCDDWVGRVSVKRLDDFERWARFELFEIVSAPSEQLVEVQLNPAAAAPQAVPGLTPPARPVSASSPPSELSPPQIEVLAVAVQPARVAPGGVIDMVISYEVSGVPPGPGFEVVERREVLRGAQRLAVFEERLARASDTYNSRQPLQLPADAAPGIYTLRAEVVMAGNKATGSALFEVVTTP